MHKSLILTTILFLIFDTVSAQEFNVDSLHYSTKPKVGLVLSGGGAKGIAHIGVLKVLEELGIRPDYIAGTSMGSIMGGLYSIGYNATELDSIIRGINWEQMLSDKVPLSAVVPVEKHDYNRFLFSFGIEKKGPQLPAGLISGQGIAEEMNYLTWHVAHIDDFDDFYIPFRCVAADLISGKEHVFSSGRLSTAMRASMAIPSIFSPVKVDTMLLVDGGVLDNIPVLVCKEMGADIIITVNVGFEDKPNMDSFNNIGQVLMGSAMIHSNAMVDKSFANTDILISPPLSGYNAGSFLDAAAIIDSGEVAAIDKYDELKELADYLNKFESVPAPLPPKPIKKLKINNVNVGKLYSLNKKFVLGKFGLDEGEYYTKREINNGLHLLIGTRYVNNVNYSLKEDGDGYQLTIHPHESYRGSLNASVHYDNVHKAGAILNTTFRNILLKGSQFKLSGDISEYPRIAFDFYDYVGQKQNKGLFTSVRWEQSRIPLYDNHGSEIGQFTHSYTDINGGIFFAPGSKNILSLSSFYRISLINDNKGLLDLLAEDVERLGNNWWGFRFNYNQNSIDNQFFPTKGAFYNVKLDMPMQFGEIYRGVDSSYYEVSDIINVETNNYIRARIDYTRYFQLGDKFNIAPHASVGWASANMPFSDYFHIGGIPSSIRCNNVAFFGLMPREVMSNQYIIAKMDFRYSPLANVYLHAIGNIMDTQDEFWIELSDFDSVNYDNKIVWGGGLIVAYQSFIGPIEVGYARTNLHNKNRWYLSVGFPF